MKTDPKSLNPGNAPAASPDAAASPASLAPNQGSGGGEVRRGGTSSGLAHWGSPSPAAFAPNDPTPLPSLFDAIVVGGGHAGCEAGMALARLGFKTLLLTMSVERLGHLSCNPAVGGLAKGHMVREIDALGGMMGLWTDAAGIQFRTLNTSKGPAVRATRVQVDRGLYAAAVQRDILAQENLWVVEDEAVDLLTEPETGDAAGAYARDAASMRAAYERDAAGMARPGTRDDRGAAKPEATRTSLTATSLAPTISQAPPTPLTPNRGPGDHPLAGGSPEGGRAALPLAAGGALTTNPTPKKNLLSPLRICGIRTASGAVFAGRVTLLTTGTFLGGRLHFGEEMFSGGRIGDPAAEGLSAALAGLGLELGRFMTCTPPRIARAGVDFSQLEEQRGDEPPPQFSFHGPIPKNPQVPCYVAYTTPAGHEVIRGALGESAMTNTRREGEGPRYCPSIEDKIVRFPDKERHQVFIEPEGLDSPWCYPNALPTGLPLAAQEALVRAMPGFERAEIAQPGYAIAYDYVPPTQLWATLECKRARGLYLAGQINGTSGYEEAAAQGLWAALNMACALRGEPPFILGRDEAYMAVLIDDLVTKGTEEPYRMFTSRAEHRLLLRESNADARLTPKGRALGLVGDAQWALFSEKYAAVARLREALEGARVTPDEATAAFLAARGEPAPGKAMSLAELLRRPGLSIRDFAFFLPEIAAAAGDVLHEVEVAVKYAGYLDRQAELVARGADLEHTTLPADLDYAAVAGLSAEVKEKLARALPRTLGQAGRISGITPAALACLQVHLKKLGKR